LAPRATGTPLTILLFGLGGDVSQGILKALRLSSPPIRVVGGMCERDLGWAVWPRTAPFYRRRLPSPLTRYVTDQERAHEAEFAVVQAKISFMRWLQNSWRGRVGPPHEGWPQASGLHPGLGRSGLLARPSPVPSCPLSPPVRLPLARCNDHLTAATTRPPSLPLRTVRLPLDPISLPPLRARASSGTRGTPHSRPVGPGPLLSVTAEGWRRRCSLPSIGGEIKAPGRRGGPDRQWPRRGSCRQRRVVQSPRCCSCSRWR
jgi:hypothetical protein